MSLVRLMCLASTYSLIHLRSVVKLLVHFSNLGYVSKVQIFLFGCGDCLESLLSSQFLYLIVHVNVIITSSIIDLGAVTSIIFITQLRKVQHNAINLRIIKFPVLILHSLKLKHRCTLLLLFI